MNYGLTGGIFTTSRVDQRRQSRVIATNQVERDRLNDGLKLKERSVLGFVKNLTGGRQQILKSKGRKQLLPGVPRPLEHSLINAKNRSVQRRRQVSTWSNVV